MIKKESVFFVLLLVTLACTSKGQKETWTISTQAEWENSIVESNKVSINDGVVVSNAKMANFKSVMKSFETKRALSSLTISQSPQWLNWQPVKNVGPSNLGDAPVALQMGEGNYWMFGKYGGQDKWDGFKSEKTQLDGFDVELETTPFKNQYNAPGGLRPSLGGYHAWQSKDMIHWVHHGPVSESFSKWMTTAEYVDGKVFLYYDFPNDQDPHLYIDDDLTDGKPGKNMGMVFKDPSDGSDCAVIRDLEGTFHMIAEDWSPLNASTHAWDSPLAVRGTSPDGFTPFEIQNYPVDERTKPTGEFAEYAHPHWHKEDPENYPGKIATEDVPQHRIKKGQTKAFAKYEIHTPEQNAFGDWASIAIGGQYYLFADYDPAGKHGREHMSVAWFTSDDINKQFIFCGNIGQGHPDPDVMFAEGQFYLVTQTKYDYVSAGPWVDGVEVRVGVDTSNDGEVDVWSDWQEVKEHYDYIEGYAKQVERIPASMDLSDLPKGYGFQFELNIKDKKENVSKASLESMTLVFE